MSGFVMGVGNARNPCRECEIVKDDLLNITNEIKCDLRSRESSKIIALSLKDKEVKEGISRYTKIYEYESFDPIEMIHSVQNLVNFAQKPQF